VTAVLLFVSANLWGFHAMGLFDGDKPAPRAAPLTEETPDPFASLTPAPSASPKTSGTPTPRPTTQQPTSEPTKTRPTRQPNRSQQRRPVRPTPVPTKPSVAPTTRPTPAPTTSQPPTREEVFAEYCRRRGWDPSWCDPSRWPTPTPRDRHRRR
jgi:hypothetical protein